jgi:VWFA-related protein
MKFFVAVFLVLTMFSSGAVTLGQNPPRRTTQSSAPKPPQPKSETLKICQGIPIPDGYIVIAYLTSAACPHGAYLLKKQNDYESSLAVNGDRPAVDDASASTKPAASKPTTTSRQASRVTSPANGKSPRNTRTPSQSPAGVGGSEPAQTASSTTRPRRVSSSDNGRVTSNDNGGTQQQTTSAPATKFQSDDATQSSDTAEGPQGPPSLIGGQLSRPPAPPILRNAGATSSPSQAGTSSDASAPTGPEEVSEGDVVRVNTSLVTVPVSVLDHQGRFVPNLQRGDFRIFENGVEQSLAYFEPAEKPFTVALLLDTSASTHFHLQEIREAAIDFAKQLRPQDRVLIVSFNDEVLLLTEATNDANLIETVIEENANTGSSTRLYDAVHLTIRDRLNKIKGRKAIVLFTDGVDTSSQQASYQSTLREVEELDALIYPIQYDTTDYLRSMQNAGSGTVTVVTTRHGIFGTSTSQQTYNMPGNNGMPLPGTTKAEYDRADRYLHALADETGGRLYQANDTTQLADSFSRIAEELRRQYSLGYYPKSDSADSNVRRDIKVRVRQPDLAVKARDSYTRSSATSPDK